jgi:hypothetical protein
MTFFNFLTGGFFGDRQNEADYFKADANWVIDAVSETDVETDELEKLRDSAYEKMSSGGDLRPRESKFVAACLVGDAYWADPLARWAPTFSRPFIYLAEPVTERRWLSVARKYSNPADIEVPSYSYPSDFARDGKNPNNYTKGFKQKAVLGAAVLDIEWLEYVLKVMEIDYPEVFFKSTIEQSIEYFAFGKEMNNEEKRFQQKQLRLAAVWVEEIEIDYHIRSYVLDKGDIALREESKHLKREM